MILTLRQQSFDLAERPLVMGVLNVTPDSFSDGGEHVGDQRALTHALAMVQDGADILDIGPESTRPGSEPVSAHEQIARSIPVIEAIRRRDDRTPISIDTRLAAVARAAIRAGADMVNDISALRDDPDMVGVVARSGAAVCLMHMRGSPADMQAGGGPAYDDVAREVTDFLLERARVAESGGIDRSRILIDPGIGFGKTHADNLHLLGRVDRFVATGYPVLIGASRKGFIGEVLGIKEPSQRQAGSLACATIAALAGAAVVRVHDVRASAEAVRMAGAIRRAGAQNTVRVPDPV